MGNSNSSTVQVGHHPIPSKWASDSIDNLSSDHRNRMKKSYFPPKHYLAQSIVQPQHLVLPKKVNPDELHLKPTSNGAILHSGGTISGRKILNELDLSTASSTTTNSRKKSSNYSNNNNMYVVDEDVLTDISTPNLSSAVETYDRENDNQKSHHDRSKLRDYDSDPDYRLSSYNSMTIDDESEAEDEEKSIQPKSLTIISESPAKKQIRCKKKSHAPKPPINKISIGDDICVESYTESNDPQRQFVEYHDKRDKKKLNRLFKTKDETKCITETKNRNNREAVRNNNCGNLEQIMKIKGEGNKKKFIEQGNHNKQLNKMNEQEQLSSKKRDEHLKTVSKLDFCRNESLSSTKPEKNRNYVTSVPTPLCSTSSSSSAKAGKMKEEEQPTSSSSFSSSKHDLVSQQVLSREAISGRASMPKNKHSSNRNVTHEPKTEPSLKINIDKKKDIHSHDLNYNRLKCGTLLDAQEVQKKTFYFGMEEDKTNTMRINNNKNGSIDNVQHASRSKGIFNNSKQSKTSSLSPPLTRSTNQHNFLNAFKDKVSSNTEANNSNIVKPYSFPSQTKSNLMQDNNNSKQYGTKREDEPQNDFEKSRTEANRDKFVHEPSHVHMKSERLGVGEFDKKLNQGHSECDLIDDKCLKANKMGQRSSSNSSHSLQTQKTSRNIAGKKNNKGNKSESDSDGIHNRQDSGNFDDFNNSDEARRTKIITNSALLHGTIHETSSSDLSSSEMDIPLVLRPTLPQKKRELSRFSPAAAWRALDSPPVSGRSLSSEEGFIAYEDGIQRYNTRPIAPPIQGGFNERSGDSGISGDSPAIPEVVIPPPVMSSKSHLSKRMQDTRHEVPNVAKCWTPQQDLDDSSSEFDENDDCVDNILATSSSMTTNVLSPNESLPPPKLTTRKYFFNPSAMYSDSEIVRQRLYTRSGKIKAYNTDTNDSFPVHTNSKPSLRRIANRHQVSNNNNRQNIGIRHGKNNDTFVGLDTNWFLSRSEPNSLNNLGMVFSHQEPKDFILNKRESSTFEKLGRDDFVSVNDNDDESKNNDFASLDYNENSLREVQSEIGYGPSSLNMHYYSNGMQRYEDEEFGLSRPFSRHIIYLPSYDSRGNHSFASYYGNRKTKSVDNLDSSNFLFKSSSSFNNLYRKCDMNLEQLENDHKLATGPDKNYCVRSPNKKSVEPVEPLNLRAMENSSNFEEQYKRKKFKFQSTLRVLERKQLEKQLAQEAYEKEMERLREVEAMKRVEEEFQKKRAKEKLESEQNQIAKSKSPMEGKIVTVKPWSTKGINEQNILSPPDNRSNNRKSQSNVRSLNCEGTTVLSIKNCKENKKGFLNGPKELLANKSSSCSDNSNNSCTASSSSKVGGSTSEDTSSSINLRTRLEPEGAPASNLARSPNDLRSELIQASKKRNGTNSSLSSSTDPLSTQELSEYRQETRQYWDYCRRNPRNDRQYYQHSRGSNSSRSVY